MAEPGPKRVMVVDDHPMVRQSLTFALNTLQGLLVVGEASNGLEAIKSCPKLKPDIIMMDVHMPGMGGIEATRTIHSLYPAIKIVIFTSFDINQELRQEAFEAGAVLCLDKQMPLENFVLSLQGMD